MSILITGGRGFLGSAIASSLAENAITNVYVTSRDRKRGSCAKEVYLDLSRPEVGWVDLLEQIDVVIHAAGLVHVKGQGELSEEMNTINNDGTAALVRCAAAAGVKRFILISTIGVNGCSSARPFKYDDPVNPRNCYSRSKLGAEIAARKVAKKAGMELVVIRPPLVYGTNAPGNFARLISLAARSWPLPFGSVNNRRSFIYVENLVDFTIRCIAHEAAANQTFLVSDGEDVSLRALICQIRKTMGRPPNLVPVPVWLFKWAGALTGKSELVEQLVGDLQVDSSKARELLSWKPPFTLAQGITATVKGLSDYE